MSTRGRIVLIAAVAVAALLIALAVAAAPRAAARAAARAHAGPSAASPPLARADAPGGPAIAAARIAHHAVTLDARSRALARAVAALGVAQDEGRPEPALDAEAAAVVDQARELLTLDPPRRGPHRATIGAGGAMSLATDAASPADARDDDGDTGDPSASAMTLDGTVAPDPASALEHAAAGPVLKRPGVWAALRFRPDHSPNGLRIDNRSGADYVVRLLGQVDGVRLDGGLVVPGRFYRIHAGTDITGDRPCGIEIRPLSAAPTWHEAPTAPPAGFG